jgi:hypothetical protein
VLFVLFSAGAHVPVMPFNEVVGKGFKTAPEQMGPTALNAGVTGVPMVPTVILAVLVQFLASFTLMI